ncbi:hypothetical protein [Kiloniella antarctica]|uniref:Uncharacterized protein n=1 Tax=Kiloniella antarctica TaxID=1550907 RepID=A0ABW5BP48_9PROT
MAQHNDLIIDDQTGADFLPDINSILMAILTQNSGNDEPPATVPFMFWAEPDADTLWQRNAANDGWVSRGSLSSGFGALAVRDAVDTDQITANAITLAKIASGTAGKFIGFDGSGNPAELDGGGKVVQMVNETYSTTATTTSNISPDDTIPQNTEGAEFFSKSITPTNSANLLRIDVVVHLGNSGSNQITVAGLFQDSIAGALSVGSGSSLQSDQIPETIAFTRWMTAGTTSEITFKIRCGASSGTTTINGAAGSNQYGGVLESSMTITEISA